MKKEFLSLIPKDGHMLGMLHDGSFRPSQAPLAQPIDDGRVLFVQHTETQALEDTTLLRVPVCLLTEGDSKRIKTLGINEAIEAVQLLTRTLPTAAMLLDAMSLSRDNKSVAWFFEDALYAQTMARTTGTPQELFLPLFQHEGEEIARLLKRNIAADKGLHVLPFSDPLVAEAIRSAIDDRAKELGLTAKQKRHLAASNAVVVASTHALFTPIASGLIGSAEQCGVEGPIHLETNPPHWSANESLAGVVRFIDQSTRAFPQPHQSMLPCLFDGEPIGEAAALVEDGPQLRRDQRRKLEAWTNRHPFPLVTNPLFGHAIGLIDTPAVVTLISDMFAAQNENDEMKGAQLQRELVRQLDTHLCNIGFWL